MDVLTQHKVKRVRVDRLQNLPNFETMTDAEFEAWWLSHGVSADLLEHLPEGDLEDNLAIIQGKKAP